MPADAEAAATVLRRSIAELCAADHAGDPQAIRAWTANKTPENVRIWMRMPHRCLLVAEIAGAICAVGAASAAEAEGEITLNYVSPDARLMGVSKAVLAALEDWLRAGGCRSARLTSTRTAHRFYRAAGYRDAGDPPAIGPLEGRPMTKPL